MAFIRRIKKGGSVYLAEVRNYREGGKVRQKVLRYIGKEVEGEAVKRVPSDSIEVERVKRWADYQALHKAARELGLEELLGEDARHILLLAYTQLADQGSIYRLPEKAEQIAVKEILGIEKLVDKHLYRALDSLEELDFGRIEEAILERLLAGSPERKALVLDVTDTYFGGSQAGWKPRRGKQGKFAKLVQIALAVTRDEGHPIMHRLHEGNVSGTRIMQDTLLDARLKRFDVTVVDRGMACRENLKDLQALGQKVICGLKRDAKLDAGYLSAIDREEIYQPAHRVALKSATVYAKAFDHLGGKLVAVYNPALEAQKRNKAMENPAAYDPLKARYYGYSLIHHTTGAPTGEVVRTYFQRDMVEKAYRDLKTTIDLAPVRKYRLGRVKAHVKICYLAYALLSWIGHKVRPLGLSAVDALEKLEGAYLVEFASKKDNFQWTKAVTLSNQQKSIAKAIGCSV